MEKEKAKPLSEILKEQFIGPVLLKTVPLGFGTSKAVRFVHVGPEIERQKMISAGIDEESILFNVAAFHAQVGKEYSCLIRQRKYAHIAEVVPVGYQHFVGTEWQDRAITNTLEVVFTKNGTDRWSAKYPETGQMILPHRDLQIPNDGKFASGTLELRPTCTRTFWIAGAPGTLKNLSAHALDKYDTETKKPERFAFADQFLIMGTWFTAFEAMGDPFMGIIETDSFTLKELEEVGAKRGKEFERWVAKNLLPVVHPDVIETKYATSKARDRVSTIAEETRYNIIALCDWLKRYSEWWVQEVRQRKAVGIRSLPPTPKPFDATDKRRKRLLLINLDRSEIERLLEPKRRPTTNTKPVTAATTKPASTKIAKSAPPPQRDRKGALIEPHIPTETGRHYKSGPDTTNSIGEILKSKGIEPETLTKARSTTKRGTRARKTEQSEIPLEVPIAKIKKARRTKKAEEND
jgi:hypothetical protein